MTRAYKVSHAKAMRMDGDGLATVHRILEGKEVEKNVNATVGRAYEMIISQARRGYVIGHTEDMRLRIMASNDPEDVKLRVCSYWKADTQTGCSRGMACDSVHMVTRTYRDQEARGNR